MKNTHCILTAIGLALLALATTGCKEGGIDARKTADALSEEFTDGLEFEDGQTQSGDIPTDIDDTLQAFMQTAPRSIGPADLGFQGMSEYDQWFPVVIQSWGTDLRQAGVVGAIAHIEQANKDDISNRYTQIIPSQPDTAFNFDQLTLRARMNHFSGVAGNAFHIWMALLKDDGSRSRFALWNLVTHPQTGESTLVPMCTCEEADMAYHNRSACADTTDGESFIAEIDESGFCSVWFSSFEDPDHDESRTFPSGTFLFPYSWFPEGEAEACKVELWCR